VTFEWGLSGAVGCPASSRTTWRCPEDTAPSSTTRWSSTPRHSARGHVGNEPWEWSGPYRGWPSRRPSRTNAALEYMGLPAGRSVEEIELDRVFIARARTRRIGDCGARRRGIAGRQGSADRQLRGWSSPAPQVTAKGRARGFDCLFTKPASTGAARLLDVLGMTPKSRPRAERVASRRTRTEGGQGYVAPASTSSRRRWRGRAIEGASSTSGSWEHTNRDGRSRR